MTLRPLAVRPFARRQARGARCRTRADWSPLKAMADQHLPARQSGGRRLLQAAAAPLKTRPQMRTPPSIQAGDRELSHQIMDRQCARGNAPRHSDRGTRARIEVQRRSIWMPVRAAREFLRSQRRLAISAARRIRRRKLQAGRSPGLQEISRKLDC